MHTVSVVIPARNEPYLHKTIRDLIEKAKGKIEVIAVLDGYWPPVEYIVNHPAVTYIHLTKSKGMRNAINLAVNLARGEYILKTDAHCMFGPGWDEILKTDCEDDWVVVPRRKRLDPESWSLLLGKSDVDYMYLSRELHGVIWDEKNLADELKSKKIDDLMSSQGSCWFMKKDYFRYLELMDEERYGTFASEFQEIGLKCWLSGGRVVVNKNTWYAHWHKPKDVGRGYSLDKNELEKATAYVEKWRTDNGWHKQIYNLDWLVEKFAPVPTWAYYEK